jgi:hypothetical protein
MKTFYNILAIVASLVVMSTANAAYRANPNNFRRNTKAGERNRLQAAQTKLKTAQDEHNKKNIVSRYLTPEPKLEDFMKTTKATTTRPATKKATKAQGERGIIRKIGDHFARHPYIYGTLGLATVGLLGYNIYNAETTADHKKVVNGLINAKDMVKNAVVSTVKSPWNWIRGNKAEVKETAKNNKWYNINGF